MPEVIKKPVKEKKPEKEKSENEKPVNDKPPEKKPSPDNPDHGLATLPLVLIGSIMVTGAALAVFLIRR